MYVLNLKQFIHLITKKKAKAVYFFEGLEIEDINEASTRPFAGMDCSSTEDLLTEVKEFSKIYPTKFTCYVSTAKNAIRTNGDKLHVDLAMLGEEAVKAVPITPSENVKILNEADIIARVTADITAKADATLTKQKLELADAKLAQLDNASEKLALVGLKFMELLTVGGQPAMQGTEGTETTEGEMTIEDAIHILRTQFGDKTLIILAKKCEADDKFAPKLKTFL